MRKSNWFNFIEFKDSDFTPTIDPANPNLKYYALTNNASTNLDLADARLVDIEIADSKTFTLKQNATIGSTTPLDALILKNNACLQLRSNSSLSIDNLKLYNGAIITTQCDNAPTLSFNKATFDASFNQSTFMVKAPTTALSAPVKIMTYNNTEKDESWGFLFILAL